jgi:hypothetical protein
LRFLGLAEAVDGSVIQGPNFSERVAEIWEYPNHNWLRITRILRSLCYLGLKNEARALFSQLEALYNERRFPITADTFRYWADAIHCDE